MVWYTHTHMNHTVFITGAAGYIGSMLADQFAKRDDVKQIICLDRAPRPQLLEDVAKIVWIQAFTNEHTWQKDVATYNPDIVIHTAWQIREYYGKQKEQWELNVVGSKNVFEFAFTTPSVQKLIHFSTVSSYSALPSNTLEHAFTEEEPLRDSEYLYAQEKKVVEESLQNIFDTAKKERVPHPQVSIIRPASITGPKGRYSRKTFGLQSALSGQLKETLTQKIVTALLAWMPITPLWCRQFIHEDDINDITTVLAFGNTTHEYEVFNACPEGPIVRGVDMADAVGKKTITLHPQIIRAVFFVAWHVSQGRIPTSPGGWKTYSYPIVVDGSKITKKYGYTYKMSPKDAFIKKEGRYAEYAK